MAILQKLTWDEAREKVIKVNPEFAQIVDNLSPDKKYTLYSLKSNFGDMIFDKGDLNLPDSRGDLKPLNHPDMFSLYGDDLSYRVIPIGMVLKNQVEVFAHLQERIIPLTVFSPGNLFGLWEAFDPPYSYFTKLAWRMSAGARSLYLFCKISDANRYRRLAKEYGIRNHPPKYLKDQWRLFKALANHPDFPQEWSTEILFFSHRWFKQLNKDGKWLTLQSYCYRYIWQQSMFWRVEVVLNLMWQTFASLLKDRGIKFSTYYLETLKHIIAMGVGALPSFMSAGLSTTMAPINGLQKILIEYYGIKDYFPTFFQPSHFSMQNPDAINYYSINVPTLIESVPRTREILNIMQSAREIKLLYRYFLEMMEKDALGLKNTPIYQFANKVSVDFFHTDPDPLGELQMSHKLVLEDPSLIAMPENYGNRRFCNTSSLLRGCIRLKSSK